MGEIPEVGRIVLKETAPCGESSPYPEQGREAGSCEHHCNGAAGFLIVVSFLAGSVEMDTPRYGLRAELTTYLYTRTCTLLQRLLLTHYCRACSLNINLQADGLYEVKYNEGQNTTKFIS